MPEYDSTYKRVAASDFPSFSAVNNDDSIRQFFSECATEKKSARVAVQSLILWIHRIGRKKISFEATKTFVFCHVTVQRFEIKLKALISALATMMPGSFAGPTRLTKQKPFYRLVPVKRGRPVLFLKCVVCASERLLQFYCYI